MTHILILHKVRSLKDGILDFKTLIQKFHSGCYSEKFLLPLITLPFSKIYPQYCSILFDKGDGSPIQAFDGFPALDDYSVTDLNGNPITGDPS